MQRDDLINYLTTLLEPDNFQDFAPNGLQVEGRSKVRRIVSGVTASQALLDAAVAAEADLILVHHGYFWKGENPAITGMKRRRLATLLAHDINLVGYHLPLDAHRHYGNNRQLGDLLGIRDAAPASGLVWMGQLPEPKTGREFRQLISERLGREPVHVESGPERISKVAWCTGGAQGYISKAIELGADAYISGEISEPTTHSARECGIHFFAAGHHATERYGAKALGEHLAEKFGLENQFIDIDNPA